MKGRKIGKRILALVLAVLMTVPSSAWSVLAATGDLEDVGSGLVPRSLNTRDTISLPIKIYDYLSDGMLFDFAESYSPITYAADTRNEKSKFGTDLIYWMDADNGLQYTDSEGNVVTDSDGNPHLLLQNYGNSSTITFYDVANGGVDSSMVRIEKGASELTGVDAEEWTGGNPTIKLEYAFGPSDSMDSRRYVVIVYRTNVTSGDIRMSFNRFYDTDGVEGTDTGANSVGNYTGAMPFTQAGSDPSNKNPDWNVWTYAVYDLKDYMGGDAWDKSTVTDCSFFMSLPLAEANQYVDITRVAFFSDEQRATNYGEYMVTEGGSRNNNKGFGLLRGTQDTSGTAVFDQVSNVENSTSVSLNTATDMSTVTTLGYQLLGNFSQGVATFGLLESAIGPNGYPVYKKEVVTYVAKLLQYSLEIPERVDGVNGNWKNYNYVKGTPSEMYGGVDLATAIRNKVNKTLGTYEETAQKHLVGTWAEVNQNITTYYDAAYFMLNSIFVGGSYNEVQTDYDYLLLSGATTQNADGTEGIKTYVFDAGFTYLENADDINSVKSGVFYDTTHKTISNISADGKMHFYFNASNTTTLFPFLPVTSKNNADGGTKSSYYQDDGVLGTAQDRDTYANRNYNYVLVSEGEFVYHEGENLFFNFEGDDDVYLFINDELVLDIGGAHSIDKYTINLNDYVNAAKAGTLGNAERNRKLSLSEGDTYSFKFYYMERHGTGANMHVDTNIKVTDPEMETTKNAYQNGEFIDFGGVIDKDGIVEYEFAITNSGLENLYNFSFRDDAIGLTIDATNGLQVTGSRVSDLNGGTLDASDLQVILRHPDYDDIYVGFNNNEELKLFLVSVNSNEAIESGAGLWPGSTLHIRGIGYTLTPEQKDAGLFDNVVYTGATNKTGNKVLYGQDNTRVFTESSLVYYEWANHELEISKSKLVQDIANRIEDTTAEQVVSIVLADKDGNPIANTEEIKIDDQGDLVLKYTTTGSKIFYVKAAHVLSNQTSTNSYGVPDSYNAHVSDGNIVFDNAYGHVFTYTDALKNGEIINNGDRAIIDNQTAYNNSNPNWAVSVQLRKTNVDNQYQVIKVAVNPGSAANAGITMLEDDIVMVEHTYASQQGNTNWKNRVAAAALKPGDLVHVSDTENKIEVTVLATQVVRAVAEVTDVKDSVFVLDYGLAVELLDNKAIFTNDTAYAPGRSTTAQVLAIGSKEPSYSPNNISFDPAGTTITGDDYDGKFVFDKDKQTLKYVPEKMMDGTDSAYIAVIVRESDYSGALELGNVNINKEVQMYKSISVLPANVVYYEDDFPAIHYKEVAGNVFTQVGGSEDLTQSADQDQAYGQDDVYKDNANADMSGNSITKITVGASGQVAHFDFTGTGFELISRTNAFDSALFSVKLVEVTKDANGNEVEVAKKNMPVITEFDQNADGGKEEIYQVPIVRVKDLALGHYRVYITGVPTRDFSSGTPVIKETILYIDGIRIFQPLGASNENYLDSENGTTFTEIRDLILKGQAAVAGYSVDGTTVSTGTVMWTENRNDMAHDGTVFEGNRVGSANDYLMLGPNNEVYMDGDYEGASALVFYVNEVGQGAHNLQIALHAVDKGQFYGTYALGMEAFVVYGTLAKDASLFSWKPLVNLYSGTEQYYTIDYTQCPYIPGRGYQVVLLVESGMVSYTGLKYTGLEIGTMASDEGDLPTIEYENGILKDIETGEKVEEEVAPALFSLRRLLATKTYFSEEDTEGDNIVIEDVEFGGDTEGDKPEEDDTEEENNNLKYQKKDKDIRLVAYVDDITAYSRVSFTLTINGKESQELVCTTAYSGLYANGELKTTKDIYGVDGYFVAYTINGYLNVYAGQEVTIKVTYTTVTGDTITQYRTATLQ